jgi:hypothetical protein
LYEDPLYDDASMTETRSGHCLALVFGLAIFGCSCQRLVVQNRGAVVAHDQRCVAVLNHLRNEITAQYGYRDGVPRINLGPCGRFAKAFREQWNARFQQKINIAFIVSQDGSYCHHVLVKLPDGSYFDGGNGVLREQTVLMLYPSARIDEMKEFNLKLLDQRSYGLGRDYPECPNYSDDLTAKLIESHLEELAR